MSNGIYLVRDDGDLVDMRSAPCASEDLLQHLLATHLSFMASDQMEPVATALAADCPRADYARRRRWDWDNHQTVMYVLQIMHDLIVYNERDCG